VSKKRILIVDDDVNIARTFERILMRKGYETDVFYTGKEALGRASVKHYDAALIDICLPDISGVEVLEKLTQFSGMVKIVITGSQKISPEKAMLADAYLVKPVKPETLLDIIKQKTSAHQQRRN
jgi:two-component system KDP operon response regulator KdpE